MILVGAFVFPACTTVAAATAYRAAADERAAAYQRAEKRAMEYSIATETSLRAAADFAALAGEGDAAVANARDGAGKARAHAIILLAALAAVAASSDGPVEAKQLATIAAANAAEEAAVGAFTAASQGKIEELKATASKLRAAADELARLR